MNGQSNAMPEAVVGTQVTTATTTAEIRPFYWSVRREFWENRFVYIVPLCVAGFIIVGFLWDLIRHVPVMISDHGASHLATLADAFGVAELFLMGAMVITCIFYCLEALHSERRDRSILFWKSLPVSDVTLVISKASLPILFLQLITFVITVATQIVMLLTAVIVLGARGESIGSIFAQAPLFRMWAILLYHLIAVHGLWYAPIYAYLLFISSVARRAAFLWAALPLVAIGIFERLAFHTNHFALMLLHRLGGSDWAAASGSMPKEMMQLTPLRFLATSGLWIGLLIAAAFLFAAMRLRRYRGPI